MFGRKQATHRSPLKIRDRFLADLNFVAYHHSSYADFSSTSSGFLALQLVSGEHRFFIFSFSS